MGRFPQDVPAPVGQTCSACDTVVAAGEWGEVLPHYSEQGVSFRPWHGECLLRNVLGGIEHLTAGPHTIGSCYEGSTLSYRESALAAYAWVQEHGV